MAIATFASKVFEVSSDKIYTFDGFQYTSALQTEKQQASKGRPKTYITGPDLEGVTFKIKLDVMLGLKPRSEWEDWISILESEIAYPFIIGGKPVGKNNWLLTSVAQSNVVLDNEGNMLSMDLEIKLDEFAYLGSATSSTKSSAKTVQGLSDADFASLIEE